MDSDLKKLTASKKPCDVCWPCHLLCCYSSPSKLISDSVLHLAVGKIPVPLASIPKMNRLYNPCWFTVHPCGVIITGLAPIDTLAVPRACECHADPVATSGKSKITILTLKSRTLLVFDKNFQSIRSCTGISSDVNGCHLLPPPHPRPC